MSLSRRAYAEAVEFLQGASVSEVADYAAGLGLTPPDDEPGWRLILDYPPGHDEQERLVWTRTLYSVIEPTDL
ncbi:hypothetical protein Afil01_29880 [Actinorhabdospora filicis]|uniref:Uncharacterized protein n=1 Tax=Actinorhabdospora filicis TaxID=1785913 RepID=A0A9W6SLU8_9ACTN|nr:hypothetical protein [Actinorhabdospora filicis]GLZ78181.1 hypothetical protein Afil01_29880 [Actinorhabdospora filicis]